MHVDPSPTIVVAVLVVALLAFFALVSEAFLRFVLELLKILTAR